MAHSILCCTPCVLLVISTCDGWRPPLFSRSGKNGDTKQQKPIKFPHVRKWCVATDIQQLIQVPGCQPKTIKNKACVGQCSSHHFPGMYPPDKDIVNRMQHCHCCKPSLNSWVKLSLNCSQAKHVDKLVEVVYECRCSRCKGVSEMM